MFLLGLVNGHQSLTLLEATVVVVVVDFVNVVVVVVNVVVVATFVVTDHIEVNNC